jgi:hypothetical protein
MKILKGISLASFACLIAGAIVSAALAQVTPAAPLNRTAIIATGLTYQVLLPSSGTRKSIQIENNNTTSTDNCWVEETGIVAAGATTATAATTADGVVTTAIKVSFLLQPGGSYTRYGPYVPSNPITGTCTSNGNSLVITTQ